MSCVVLAADTLGLSLALLAFHSLPVCVRIITESLCRSHSAGWLKPAPYGQSLCSSWPRALALIKQHVADQKLLPAALTEEAVVAQLGPPARHRWQLPQRLLPYRKALRTLMNGSSGNPSPFNIASRLARILASVVFAVDLLVRIEFALQIDDDAVAKEVRPSRLLAFARVATMGL
eukprot:SAG31_NODE_3638_length_4034_cov_4.484371_5_plen_176_part_00